MAINIGFEIERLVNLIKGFEWEKTKEEKTPEKLIVTIEKKIELAENKEETSES